MPALPLIAFDVNETLLDLCGGVRLASCKQHAGNDCMDEISFPGNDGEHEPGRRLRARETTDAQ
jgi:hypothetical protein